MYKLYRVYCDWDENTGYHIGTYGTEDEAINVMTCLAKEQIEVYYLQVTAISDKEWVYDYGSHTKFYKIIGGENNA